MHSCILHVLSVRLTRETLSKLQKLVFQKSLQTESIKHLSKNEQPFPKKIEQIF